MIISINNTFTLLICILTILNLFIVYKFNLLSKMINIFDYPDNKRKIHSKPISLLGGPMIFLSLIITFAILFLIDKQLIFNYYIFSDKNLLIFLLTVTIIFSVGIYDDKYDLAPSKRLVIIAISIYFLLKTDNTLLLNELNFSFSDYKIQTSSLNFVFTLICFISLILALNMFDGINLQSGIFYFLFFLFSIFFTKNLFLISFLIPIIFFLYLNLKNKAFLGDSGSYILGLLVSFLIIKFYKYNSFIFSDHIFTILFLPIFDCARVTVSRILSGTRIFQPDKTHFHHILINKYKYRNTILIILMMSLFPYLCFLLKINSIFTILILVFFYFYLIYKK